MAKPNGKANGKTRKPAPKREHISVETCVVPSPAVDSVKEAADYLQGEFKNTLNACHDLLAAGVTCPEAILFDLANIADAVGAFLRGGVVMVDRDRPFDGLAPVARALADLEDNCNGRGGFTAANGISGELDVYTVETLAHLAESAARALAEEQPYRQKAGAEHSKRYCDLLEAKTKVDRDLRVHNGEETMADRFGERLRQIREEEEARA